MYAQRMPNEAFVAIDAAIRGGDYDALAEVLGRPPESRDALGPVREALGPIGTEDVLVYCIYHAPFALIRELLERGADPNVNGDGFPPLHAAIGKSRSHPGTRARPDALAIASLLLECGADPNQRGVNDYTPLHAAVAAGQRSFVDLLLAHGADPTLETRIDDYETPADLAAAGGHFDLVELLRRG